MTARFLLTYTCTSVRVITRFEHTLTYTFYNLIILLKKKIRELLFLPFNILYINSYVCSMDHTFLFEMKWREKEKDITFYIISRFVNVASKPISIIDLLVDYHPMLVGRFVGFRQTRNRWIKHRYSTLLDTQKEGRGEVKRGELVRYHITHRSPLYV